MKFINKLLYGGLSKNDYESIKDDVIESNRESTIYWSLVCIGFWVMSLILSINNPAFTACRFAYILGLVICVITLVISMFVSTKNPSLIFPTQCLFLFSTIAASIGIAIFQPNDKTITIFVMAVILPCVYVVSTRFLIIFQVSTLFALLLAGKGIISEDIFVWTIKNYIIFASAGVIVGHTMNKSHFERFLYAKQIKQHAKEQQRNAYCDYLTGLKNRRAFSEKIEKYAQSQPEELTIIFVDINGLKVINDQLGHAAGDEVIVGASQCLTKAFKTSKHIYRIGGDEFCIMTEHSPENAQKHIETLKKLSENYKGQYIQNISLSYGLCSNRDIKDVEEIIKEADRAMYKYKREYYSNLENDRRKEESKTEK